MLFGKAPLAASRVVSVVGSGGKTSLLTVLAKDLPGTVALCTTTHVRPFAGVPTVTGGASQVLEALSGSRVVCVGTPASEGKLVAPQLPIDELAGLVDHVVVEADGSRHLPFKAHAPWEPVVPACSDACVLVVGAGGFGRPIEEVVHRPGIFCARLGCWEDDLATPGRVARVIAAERGEGLLPFDRLLVNQLADDRSRQAALALVQALRSQGVDVPYELASLPRP